MEEKVLISIEIEKPEGEAQIDALTKKITDLQKATAELKKENNELIKAGKENSDQYIENTRQIEVNKQKINESVASRKGLVQTILAEDNSIKALQVRNAELTKERNKLNTATTEGRARIAEINAELDKNNATIVANSSAMEKQRFNIGNYGSALKGVSPLLGGFVEGIGNIGTAVRVALAAFGPFLPIILAIGGAIKAFQAYINGSEEGQNRWNKVVQVGSAILEQFMNIVEDVGEIIFDAFENPKQAAIDLMNFLEDQFVNRIVGMIELIPKLGEAVNQLFQGNFAEAGKIAGDAVGKVVLGIENATDVIAGFIEETGALIEQGIRNGERIAALQAQIDRDERALIVQRQKDALEVAKLREAALQQEGEERKKILLEAIALEEQLAAQEVNLAKTRLALAEATLKANGDDKEALKEVAQARADVFAAEATAFQNTLRFRKEIAAIDKQAADDALKLAEEEAKIRADQAAAEEEQFKNNLAALDKSLIEKQTKIKEDYANNLLSKEEFQIRDQELELQALETKKEFLIAYGEDVVEIEEQIANQVIAIKESQAAREKKANDQKMASDKAVVENERALTNARLNLLGSLGGFLQQIAGRNKALAITAVAIQKAAAIGQIIANTAIANAKAIATFWITGGMPWVAINTAQAVISIASVVAEAGQAISQISAARRGMLIPKFGRGGIAQTGGILRGPSHERGGIPFTVNGRFGFEAEGDEAIINKKSTRMFRPLLSRINQLGGGVPFGRGGIPERFQTGAIIGSQTSAAAANAESKLNMAQLAMLLNQVQPVLVLEEFEAKQNGVHETKEVATIM